MIAVELSLLVVFTLIKDSCKSQFVSLVQIVLYDPSGFIAWF